jgi:hypothetical protein
MEAQNHIGSYATTLKRPPKGLRQRLERLLAGISGALPDGTSIPTPDGSLSRDAVMSRLSQGLARFEAIDAQLIALQQARKLLLKDAAELQRVCNMLNDSIAAIIGRESPLMEHFGFKQRKPRQPLTSQQQLVRAVKARETRRLRHTAGRRQKAELRYRGVVDVSSEFRPATTPDTPPSSIDPPAHGAG